MNVAIDTTFDVYSDTPAGMDPDSYSPTLRRYHQGLWSKPLPNGVVFSLSVEKPRCYLHHSSKLGDFALSSDSIGHTYRFVKATAKTIEQVETEELEQFFRTCSTIGGYIVFPSRRIDGKATINGARGLSAKIRDRFDLTLECIRRHYLGQASPLSDSIERYDRFFKLFDDFSGYVEFFMLQDLVLNKGSSVNFFLPFDGFISPPLPTGVDQYRSYKAAVSAFVTARNRRISLAK
jgi:hypothetical protein